MRLLSLALFGILFSSGAALACSCAGVTPRSCNLLANRDVAIFVGTVVSVENPPKEGNNRGGTARYHFRVEEWMSPDALPDSEYAITAQTNFCDPETVSPPLTFLGGSAPPELTITVPDTKCKELPQEMKRRSSK